MACDMVTDDGGCECAPSVLNDFQTIISHTHPSQSFDPTNSSFDNPTHLAKSTPMRRSSSGNLRFDSQPNEQRSSGVVVIATVRIRNVGKLLRSPGFTTHVRKVDDNRKDFG